MSREVKIKHMQEEKQPFSEGMSKLVATTIGLLLIAVIGQGLLIWKNQANVLEDIIDLEQEVVSMHSISDRLLQLELAKNVAYGRIITLEETVKNSEVDKYQRGGSWRRNDAMEMRTELERLININMGKIAALEWKLDNLNERTVGSMESDIIEIEKSISSIQIVLDTEHVKMREEIMENSAEDNIRHASLQERADITAKALVSLNNEFNAFREKTDKLVKKCEELNEEKINEFNTNN